MSYQPAAIGTTWECASAGLIVLVVGRHPKMSAMSRCLVLLSDDDTYGVIGLESTYIIPSASREGDIEKWKQVLL